MNLKVIYFSLALIFACAFVMVITHELTHYLLVGNAKGLCLGKCDLGNNAIGVGALHYTTTPTSNKDELIPIFVGAIVSLAFGIFGIVISKGGIE